MHKKTIPHPHEVPAHKHDEVLAHVGQQFMHGHYQIKPGSVNVSPETVNPETGLAESTVTFTRTHDPKVAAEHHGIDLTEHAEADADNGE